MCCELLPSFSEARHRCCYPLVRYCKPKWHRLTRPVKCAPSSLKPGTLLSDSVQDYPPRQHLASLYPSACLVELGQAKNPNKNSTAERALQKFEMEIGQEPLGGAIFPLTSGIASSAFKPCFCSWAYRRGSADTEGPVFKQTVTDHWRPFNCPPAQAVSNHPHSKRSKALMQERCPTPLIDGGELVYLHSDQNKSRACDHYTVVSINWISVTQLIIPCQTIQVLHGPLRFCWSLKCSWLLT